MKVSCDVNFHLLDIISVSVNVIIDKSLNYVSFLTNWIHHTYKSQTTLKILTQFKVVCPYPQ